MVCCSSASVVTAGDTLLASVSGTFLQTARFGYATEGALFISAQLSADAVSALRKVRVLIIWLWKQPSAQSTHVNTRRIHPGWNKKRKEFRLDSNDCGFIWAGVSNMVSYITNVWYKPSCL